MKKFYYKKNVPQEEKPILTQLERSHTLLNALASDANSKEWHELGSRSRSVDLTECDPRRENISSVRSDGNEWSPISSMIIKDSDLASSWIYSRKKGQNNPEKMFNRKYSDPNISAAVNDAFQSESPDMLTSPGQLGNKEPSIDDTESPGIEFKRIPIAPMEAPKSSCCCYMSVMLIIFVCSLGILSAIGGIIYLELFAPHRAPTVLPNVDKEFISATTVSIGLENEIEISTVTSLPKITNSADPLTTLIDKDIHKTPVETISRRKGKMLEPTEGQHFVVMDDLPSTVTEDTKELHLKTIPSTNRGFTEEHTSVSVHEKESKEWSTFESKSPYTVETESAMWPTPENKSTLETESKEWSTFGNKVASTLETEPIKNENSTSSYDYNKEMLKNAKTMENTITENMLLETTENDESYSRTTQTEFGEYFQTDISTSIIEESSKSGIGTEINYDPAKLLTQPNPDIESTAQNQNLNREKPTKRHGIVEQAASPLPADAKSTTKNPIGKLQESIANILRQFQKLNFGTLPNSRLASTKKPNWIKTPTLKFKSIETSTEIEQKQYLDKLRVLMFQSNR